MANKFRDLQPFEFGGSSKESSTRVIGTVSSETVIFLLILAALLPQAASFVLRSIPYEEITSDMNSAYMLLYCLAQMVVLWASLYIRGRFRILIIVWALINLCYTIYSFNQFNQ